jgi:hypothetical protein
MTKKELDERVEKPPGLCLKKLYQNSNVTGKGRPLALTIIAREKLIPNAYD